MLSNALGKMVFLLALGCLPLCQAAQAQTAQFAYATAVSGLNNAAGVAVDNGGALYIADTGDSRVLKETPAGGGYTQTVIAGTAAGTPLYGPFGVAVDSGGSVYIADGRPVTNSGDSYYQQYRILKETPAGTGYTQTVVRASAAYAPYGVTVDANGNVFAVEGTAPTAGASRIVKETFAAGAWTETVAVASLPYSEAYGIAVDAAGDLFVTNTQLSYPAAYSAVYKETPVSGTYTQSTLGSGLNYPWGIAVDGTGNLYLADLNNYRVLRETPSGSSYTQAVLANVAIPQGVAIDGNGAVYVTSGSQVLQVAGGINFGAEAIGGTSATRTLTFKLTGSGTIGSTAVLTQGATGLDFADAGGGTCAPSATGPTCVVNVSFTPQAAGARYGAVNLYGGNGNVLATVYLYGTGVGPQVAFSPTVQSVVTGGLNSPYGVAADGSGTVYMADTGDNCVQKATPGAGGYGLTLVACNPPNGTANLNLPYGVAVDGAGNVYIADTYNNQVLKETLSSGAYVTTTVASGLDYPNAVAVDGSGNVYIANTNSNAVLKETVVAGGYLESGVGSGLLTPKGIAVDDGGTVYIADTGNARVVTETPSLSGIYMQATLPTVAALHGFDTPFGIAVDGGRSVYIADRSAGEVLKETVSGGGYTESVIMTGVSPWGLAADGAGNVYVTDASNGRVLKQDAADAPALSFAGTAVGSNSSDSPKTVMLQNIGNGPLSFSVPSTGSNVSVSANFSLGANSTCPQLTSSSSVGSLAAGSSCTEILSFAPVQAGTINGALIATDNNLNAAGATQSVSLGGTATPGTPVLTVSPASVVYGTRSATLTALVAYGGVAPAGAVTFTVDGGAGVAGACSASSFTRTCIAGYAAGALAVGNHSIAVSEAADSNYVAKAATGVLSVTQATPVMTVVPLSIGYGTASATLTATVAYTGTAAPQGGLSFSVDGGTAVAGVCSGSSSPLTCTTGYATAGLSGGGHTIAASLAADTNYVAVARGGTLMVTQATPTLAVGSSSLVYGTASTTLTATVSYTGGAAPGGGVSFGVDGGAAMAATCTGSSSPLTCSLIYATSNLNAGSHTVAVSLASDANYMAASRTGSLTITQATPTVAVVSSPVVYGTAFTTLTAQVAYAGGAAPTGGLSFSVDGGSAIGAVCAGASSLTCTASFRTAALNAGSHTVAANLLTDTNYAAGAGSGTLAVTKAMPIVTVSSPSIVYGTTSTTLTSSVAYTGSAAPSGGLSFSVDGGAAVPSVCAGASSSLTCTVSYAATSLTGGGHTLIAREAEDANYAAGTSAGTLTVTRAPLTVTVSAPVVVLGAGSTTVTATIAYTGPAAPAGGLSFVVDGGTAVAGSCAAGASPLVCTGSIATAALAVGAHTLTATEAADANYASAVGTATLTVSDATLFPSCALTVGAASAPSAIIATPTCTDPQNQSLTLTLNWGDGSSQAAANQTTTPHPYANLAVATPYTVTVTATDSGGRSSSASQSILVVPSVPVASPGSPAQITTTLSSQPPTTVPTLVTFVCASVSTAVNGQTMTTLPSQYGISCTSPQVDASKGPVTVNVTVQTTAATTTVTRTAFSNTLTAFCVVLLPFGTLLPRQGRSRRSPLLTSGVLLLLCLVLSSCGGSFTPPPSVATPLGSYYLTITEVVVGGAPAPTGFVQTSLIVPITVGK